MPAWHHTLGLCRGRLSLAVLALTEALMLMGKLSLCRRDTRIRQNSQGKLNLQLSLFISLFVCFCIQERESSPKNQYGKFDVHEKT